MIRLLTEILRQGRRYRRTMFEPMGLNCKHTGCLAEIADHPGISQDQLAQLLCIDKSNIARRVADLEEEGYVERCPSARDRRVMELKATAKAEAILPGIRRVLSQWDDYLTADMTDEERAVLEQLLLRIRNRAVQWKEEEHV